MIYCALRNFSHMHVATAWHAAVPGLGTVYTSVRAAALHKFNVNHTLKQPLTNTHHIN